MTKAQIEKLVAKANELEGHMIREMSASEYESYMAMSLDDRFMLVCAGLAAAAA